MSEDPYTLAQEIDAVTDRVLHDMRAIDSKELFDLAASALGLWNAVKHIVPREDAA